MPHARLRFVAAGAAAVTGLAGLALVPGVAQGAAAGERVAPDSYNIKTPTSTGYGGAVTSVDPEASRIGIEVLRKGGNAVDAAVATAAALGVTEPYSSGIGGGGYFVHYNARTGKVDTLDGRETAPKSMPNDAFIDPAAETGAPYPQTPENPALVTSGVSVGTPGTLATWEKALDRWGSTSLGKALRPATKLADRGFVVDSTFNEQTADNKLRFSQFPETSRLFLPGGQPPAVGSVFRNPDLADTYRLIAERGTDAFYTGPLARQISRDGEEPSEERRRHAPRPARLPGAERPGAVRVRRQAPTKVGYRGLDIYGMAPSSSGGSTVGEALNILERYRLRGMSDADALHRYLEASALAFADRGEYVGDPAYVKVPLRDLLSDKYAAERACEIDPGAGRRQAGRARQRAALRRQVRAARRPGEAEGRHREHQHHQPDHRGPVGQRRGVHPDHRADRWIRHHRARARLPAEQRAHGLLHGRTTTNDPNRIEGGKRPRSSMSPTIVLRNGKPVLALGSPGGSTIITTVLQMLFNRIDRGMTIEQAIAAPRASQRNMKDVTAEPAFIEAYEAQLKPFGHTFVLQGDAFTSKAEIGAATAIEFGRRRQADRGLRARPSRWRLRPRRAARWVSCP